MSSTKQGTTHAERQKPLVLITGVSGLIGSRLAKSLSPDYQLVGLDVAPPSEENTPVTWIETDLTDSESVTSALESVRQRFGTRIASVIHLAAYYDFSGESSPLYQDLTVQGTRRILRGLKPFDVEQFVFSSTLLVMKPEQEGVHLSEFSETRAEWEYPQSKLDAERVIREEHGRIPFVILRLAGVYDEACHSLPISQQIARIYEKQLESFVYPGDPDHGQAFVHLDDFCNCVCQVIEHRHHLKSDEVFLVAEPEVMSYGELQDEIGMLIHKTEWPTIRIPKMVAKAGAYVKNKLSSDDDKPFIKPWMIDLADDHYQATIAHARNQLDWEPKHRLRGTLPAMISALLKDPKHWYETNGLPVPKEVASQ